MNDIQRYEERLSTPPFFQDLRNDGHVWVPSFYEVDRLGDVAIAINTPHEDFPYRVIDTANTIRHIVSYFRKSEQKDRHISSDLLLHIHRNIFPPSSLGDASGKYRQCNVTVGSFMPPKFEMVDTLMSQLVESYHGMNMNNTNLINWYSDFETIHPFVDGNGRVGGVVVATLSYLNTGLFLAPCQ